MKRPYRGNTHVEFFCKIPCRFPVEPNELRGCLFALHSCDVQITGAAAGSEVAGAVIVFLMIPMVNLIGVCSAEFAGVVCRPKDDLAVFLQEVVIRVVSYPATPMSIEGAFIALGPREISAASLSV